MGWKNSLATLLFLGSMNLGYAPSEPQAPIPSTQTESTPRSFKKHNDSLTKLVKKPKAVIVIDPGHSSKHTGKHYYGLKEEETTLTISKKLKEILEENNYEVHLTRENEQPLSTSYRRDLQKRSTVAKEKNADYFLSIHFNYYKKPSVRGMELMYYGVSRWSYLNNGKRDFFKPEHTRHHSDSSRQFALQLKQHLDSTTNIPVKVKGTDVFNVRRNFGDQKELNRKTLLVELGYISNPQDRELLKNNPEHYAQLLASYFK